MTTTVMIKTVEGEQHSEYHIVVGDLAQRHVLRTFNPTSDVEVDKTKVLCAALIQQMLTLKAANMAAPHIQRACAIAITQIEALQMQAVKANFVQA